jgi:predicted AAA+ superfamily ATPase
MAARLYPRLLKAPGQSFFLFGPRGTGKSTWVRQAFPKARRIDLLEESLYQSYLANVGLFADELRSVTPGSVVCVDEVQRLPQLLNEVHRFIEERRLRFILCGSSARKLKREGTNLLAGRALRRVLHPFLPAELGADFDLEPALTHGTLPVIWQAMDRKEALRAYVQLYLKEEIQAEALVRNLPGFARFLPVAALFHGQTLNVASLARDAETSRTTIIGYLDILEDTLLAFRLPAFEARMRVREKKHPKLYWVDAGIVRAVKRQVGTLSGEERGPLFEGWVANLLRAYRDYCDLFDDWSYWSPAEATRTEVDFVLRRGRDHVAVEAKSATRVGFEELRGLRAIAELPRLRRRILVHPGRRTRVTEDGIEIWPVSQLITALEADQFWPS